MFLFLFFLTAFKKFVLFLVAVCRAFSSCGEGGLLFVAMRGCLVAVAPLPGEHRPQDPWASVVAALGLRR